MNDDRDPGLIRIRGACQNNLRNVDVDLPRNALVAITGVSGSGKSSLAFDTLFREGQRRFLETLSAYARQFLGQMSKPDVESIEGLSPAIAVDQKTIARGSRSTVGTLTEIVDHLRVLYARAGVAYSPWCDLPVESRTPESVVQELLREYEGQRTLIAGPLVRDRKGAHKALFESLRKKGFVRVRVDGEVMRVEEVPELERYKRHSIEVIVDRIKPHIEDAARLRDAVNQALEFGHGDLVVITPDGAQGYSTRGVCPETGRELAPLEPRLFSFNSPHGACPTCEGLGELRVPSELAVVRDPDLSIRDGALAVTRASGGALLFPRCDFEFLERVGTEAGFDLDTPWCDLSRAGQRAVMHGTGDKRFRDTHKWNGERFQGSATWMRHYHGVIGELKRSWERGSRKKMVERFLTTDTCPDCGGSRINEVARAVRFGDRRFAELTSLPVGELTDVLRSTKLNARQTRIARDLLQEIERRVDFLCRVGLGYLSLERSADSLSGGEAQRIRLAAQLGAGLQGVLYVLDEPSIGLHARDHGRLLGALARLRDAGNSVVVVEHDEATLRAADYLIDVGPGAGRQGGQIVAAGTPSEVAKADTPTGRLLRGEIVMPKPKGRRAGHGTVLGVRGASAFNLKNVDVDFPLGTLTVVTGVSGSGKSTLVNRTLRRAVLRHLERETPDPGAYKKIEGLEHIDEMVAIDAAPIGRTTRSNPATYTKVLGPIRDLFAMLPESLLRGYNKSRFSFNVTGGRCETCCGSGAKYVELQFLAPVTVPCEECGGKRFQATTLDVKYEGHSISDVLDMTAAEAAELFEHHPKIVRPLELMVEIGLGYLTLGQPSTTLSGGEAQRMKLVTHLSKRPKGHTLYLLDEPTTGLHMEDVGRLVAALQRLVDLGHTVIVVEHNLELVSVADHVIDLGLEGGAGGGELIFSGSPEDLVACKDSRTGAALRELKSARSKVSCSIAPGEVAAPVNELRIVGANTHNLRNIDVNIPRDAMTVITGPSGSGKSSLALDTIHTEGRRRFVESLSTYARQFLGTKDKPPVERIEGLGPSVAVEARTVGSHPRSTVATTTEIHDHVRVLWARAGTPYCPTHGEKLEAGDATKVARKLIAELEGERGWLVAPVFGHGQELPENLQSELRSLSPGWTAAGFVRLLVDGEEQRLEGKALEEAQHDWAAVKSIDLVIDRVAFKSESRARVAEAVEQASVVSHGRVSAISKNGRRVEASTSGACTQCGFQLDSALEPRHFSFNTHVGACDLCDGLGETVQCVDELLVTHPENSIVDGAIGGKLGRYLTKGKGYYEMLLREVASTHRINLERPFERLSEKHRNLILFGTDARGSYRVNFERHTRNADVEESFTATWPGLCGHVDAWHAKTDDADWATLLEEVMRKTLCGACQGERLKPGFRSVTVGRKRITQFLGMTVSEGVEWLRSLRLKASIKDAVEPVLIELRSRLALLDKVGLGYLTLDRATGTLSGGEARRVRLSASLGSQLVGVCYVLDEPTVGLHPQDVERLTDALLELKDRGNTVIVVEHDGELMRRADWLVDMGPGAGEAGGRVVAVGTPADIMATGTSGTADYLRGEIDLAKALAELEDDDMHPKVTSHPRTIKLSGARTHNLRGVGLEVPFGQITGICGPSGSGKSTLVLDTLVPAAKAESSRGRWSSYSGLAGGGLRIMVVDASPIGRTPYSVPATYTGLITILRELFARTPEARMKGLSSSAFSFNSKKGRCAACDGRGAVLVEMQFLADLWLTCEECDGKRYRPEVLEVRYRGRSMADVLAMSVDEAAEFLESQPKAAAILQGLRDVGLGYLRLGQSSTTLSGGEAQRVKLASELLNSGAGRALIVLDEPSTGLAATDTVHLARVLGRLARRGHAVVLIEHHTELLTICDRLVELGPGGGEAGGRIIASGTPLELSSDPASITGPWLGLGKGPGGQRRKTARKKTARKQATGKSRRPKARGAGAK